MYNQPLTVIKQKMFRFFSNLALLVAGISLVLGMQPFMLGYWDQFAPYLVLSLVLVGISLMIKNKVPKLPGSSFSTMAFEFIFDTPPQRSGRRYYVQKLYQVLVAVIVILGVAWYIYSLRNSLAPLPKTFDTNK